MVDLRTNSLKTEAKIFDTDLVSRVTSIDVRLNQKFKTIHDDMVRNYNMVVSDSQWDIKSKEKLNSQGRPALAYNLISPPIKILSSIERGSRKKLVAQGLTANDYGMAKTISHTMQYFLDKTNFDYHKSRAFLDAIISKWGFLYNNWSYEDDPEGSFIVQAINPLRIKFDFEFTDISLKNSSYLVDSDFLTFEEILTKYALNNKELQNAIIGEARNHFSYSDADSKKHVTTLMTRLFSAVTDWFTNDRNSQYYNRDLRTEGHWFNSENGKFAVVEAHERRLSRKLIFYDPDTNQNIDITTNVLNPDGYTEDREKVKLILKKFPKAKDPRWEHEKELWITAVCPALNVVLYDKPYAVQNGNFLYTPVFAWNFSNDLSRSQSIVDELIDPQSDYNKRRSTMLEQIMRYSAKGYIIQGDAINEYMDEWTNPKIGGFKRINNINSYREEVGQAVSPDLIRDAQESKGLIPEISLINNAMRGMQESAAEPAKAYLAKRDQTVASLQHIFDNLNFGAIQIGKNCLAHIQKFCTEERIIRITEDENAQSEDVVINQRMPIISSNGKLAYKIINDVSIGKYDIQISSTPYGATAREIDYIKTVDMLSFVSKFNPALAEKMLPILIKSSDTPYRTELLEIIQKQIELAEGQGQPQLSPEQMQEIQMQQQLVQRKAELEMQETQTDIKGKVVDMQDKVVEIQGKMIENEKNKLELKLMGMQSQNIAKKNMINQLLGIS